MPYPPAVSKLIYFILKLLNRKNAGLVLTCPGGKSVEAPVSFYDLEFTDLSGKRTCFSEYRSKKILLVNTASACGYTEQYRYLEKLYRDHSSKLVIVAFPSNDFGKQEQGSNEEINLFCKEKFHITFPVSQKVKVKGTEKHKVYQWLTDAAQNGWNKHEPGWNFCKYLVNEEGKLINFFSEKVYPSDRVILDAILK